MKIKFDWVTGVSGGVKGLREGKKNYKLIKFWLKILLGLMNKDQEVDGPRLL